MAALALSLAGCGKSTDSDDSDTSKTGFVGAWRQFLELDAAAPNVATFINPTGSVKARPMTAAAASRISPLATDLAQVTEQVRTIYGDASAITTGFPSAEETYRNLPHKFSDQVTKVRANKGQADAATIRRRLTELTTQAMVILERQHARVASLQTNFQQRMNTLVNRVPELEKACAKAQAEPAPKLEEVQACSKFLDASTMLKTKSDIVASGFANLDSVYNEVKQTQQGLNNEILAGK